MLEQIAITIVLLVISWFAMVNLLDWAFGKKKYRVKYISYDQIPKPGQLMWTPDLIPTKNSKWFPLKDIKKD